MPLYTYKCHSCRAIFDVRHGMFFEDQRCVKCHSDDVFRLPSEDLEKTFLSGADAAGLLNLKGHRSVGGIRASIYNAMPKEGVQALVTFMSEFQGAHLA